MTSVRPLTGVVFVLTALGQCLAAPASPDTSAMLLELMKDRDRSIQKIVSSDTRGETDSERKQLRDLVGELFDFHRYSKMALGRYWDKRSEAEQAEFADLCRRLIEKNYADPKLYTKSDRIDYISAEVDGNEGVVRTVVYYKSEQSSIDYQLHLVDGNWLVYDMVIDDLSVAKNNRSQFRREIRKTSYEGLVSKLQDKLAEQAGDEKDEE